MIIDDAPRLVTSSKSQRVLVDGLHFDIQIFRLEGDKTWTLEVVDHEGTSQVWNEQFSSDSDARNAALQAIEQEGAFAFMHVDNVVPFKPS